MSSLIALLPILAGATLVYLTSTQQRLRLAPLPAAARAAGWLLIAMGTLYWWRMAGAGAGIAGALSALMLAWVALPYLAWWRAPATDASER
ncbi:hypothetical protein DVT68_00860 [Dyella solisilvae]|uniref:DUF3325 domain-containing protein n=1 Tax=Dyella solisilvae TaxID=1920168 RepID=A0A370K9Z1_9GAMM|nr:hypothetical protein [Dyella solisilvae]RDI99445.1 hypothetical protein DVT68_00860 [Dyella solisilvae]